jgi:Mn2+/Fe2+ NRAMP family transporter
MRITRWTSLICPKCHSIWNRRWDLEFWSIILCVALYIVFKGYLVIIVGMIIILIAPFIDAATIRLLAAKKRIGWRRILGDKTERG